MTRRRGLTFHATHQTKGFPTFIGRKGEPAFFHKTADALGPNPIPQAPPALVESLKQMEPRVVAELLLK